MTRKRIRSKNFSFLVIFLLGFDRVLGLTVAALPRIYTAIHRKRLNQTVASQTEGCQVLDSPQINRKISA